LSLDCSMAGDSTSLRSMGERQVNSVGGGSIDVAALDRLPDTISVSIQDGYAFPSTCAGVFRNNYRYYWNYRPRTMTLKKTHLVTYKGRLAYYYTGSMIVGSTRSGGCLPSVFGGLCYNTVTKYYADGALYVDGAGVQQGLTFTCRSSSSKDTW
jgi:hypothetical protein